MNYQIEILNPVPIASSRTLEADVIVSKSKIIEMIKESL
jgi:hypothetical protein